MNKEIVRTEEVPAGKKVSIGLNENEFYEAIGATEGHLKRVVISPAKGEGYHSYINVHNKNTSPISIHILRKSLE